MYSSRISCSRGVKRDVDLDGLLGLLGLLVAIVRIVGVGVQRDCKFRDWMCTSKVQARVYSAN